MKISLKFKRDRKLNGFDHNVGAKNNEKEFNYHVGFVWFKIIGMEIFKLN